MQIKPLRRPTIQGVAHNRTIQPERVGGVNAQLMRASGAGEKGDTCSPAKAIQRDVLRDSRLAVFLAHDLPRAIQRVGTKRLTDDALVIRNIPVQQGDVFFLDRSMFELRLQVLMRFLALRREKNARRIPIQSMREQWPGGIRVHPAQEMVDGVGVAFSWYGKHAGGLIHRHNVRILVQDAQVAHLRSAYLGCGRRLQAGEPRKCGGNRRQKPRR